MAPHEEHTTVEIAPYRSGSVRRSVALVMGAFLAVLIAISMLYPVNVDAPPWYVALVNGGFKLAWTNPAAPHPALSFASLTQRGSSETPFTSTIERSPESLYVSVPLAMGLLLPLLILVFPVPAPKQRPDPPPRAAN